MNALIEYHGDSQKLKKKNGFFTSSVDLFKELFLPNGYPNSVTPDYLTYQLWDSVQAIASSICTGLSISFIFQSYGVGDARASAFSAAIIWLLKDGSGMIGRILFAWCAGLSLGVDSKRWRFIADVMCDLSVIIELAAPLFKHWVICIFCLSNICKAVVQVAGGVTRTAVAQHQAICNNIADVMAKDGSQETLVNLISLLLNFLLLNLVREYKRCTYAVILVCICIHLYSNYRAIRSLNYKTLNESRLRILCEKFFSNCLDDMTVEKVNRHEPFLLPSKSVMHLRIGCRLLDNSMDRQYVKEKLDSGMPTCCLVNFQDNEFSIICSTTVSSDDLLRACFKFEILNYALRSEMFDADNEFSAVKHSFETRNREMLDESLERVSDKDFGRFLSIIKNLGWITSPLMLKVNFWRYKAKNS